VDLVAAKDSHNGLPEVAPIGTSLEEPAYRAFAGYGRLGARGCRKMLNVCSCSKPTVADESANDGFVPMPVAPDVNAAHECTAAVRIRLGIHERRIVGRGADLRKPMGRAAALPPSSDELPGLQPSGGVRSADAIAKRRDADGRVASATGGLIGRRALAINNTTLPLKVNWLDRRYLIGPRLSRSPLTRLSPRPAAVAAPISYDGRVRRSWEGYPL
jgi:hypothetical protein